jgi:UDP-N-acetylmuramoyl-L-alanyl-D-glutamate--2,6-diaminopimelate ligase
MLTDRHSAARQPPGVSLGELAALTGAEVVGDREQRVTGVQQDSRRVQPGDLFVALAGARAEGVSFVPQALANGAVAVLADGGVAIDPSVPRLVAAAPRAAMADAAARVYGRPTERLTVVGITGTNGKTTTASLVAHALDAVGHKAGVIGTLGYRFGDLSLPASHTSPEADELQRLALAMLERGATHLVMEVSSIALAAERVRGVRFAVGAFTNLTQDHLDYHGTMDAYAAAKQRLFGEHAPAHAVINVDDPEGVRLAARAAARLVTFSAKGAEATVRVVGRQHTPAGIELDVVTPAGEARVASRLIGAHNGENLLAALAIGHALGVPLPALAEALGGAPAAPGRLERCDEQGRDDIIGLVDYAHTPDALERALASVRPLTRGRLWCVFGCGGDRDAQKRGPMGAAVARGADMAIVTNDNPRSEDPGAIAAAVVEGLGPKEHAVVLDRAAAIERAVSEALPGDVVLVAGKGHETYQVIADRVYDFDDRRVLRAALSQRRSRLGRADGQALLGQATRAGG